MPLIVEESLSSQAMMPLRSQRLPSSRATRGLISYADEMGGEMAAIVNKNWMAIESGVKTGNLLGSKEQLSLREIHLGRGDADADVLQC